MPIGLQLFPTSASTIGNEIDLLYFFLVAVTAFFTALVFVLVVFFALYYRRKTPEDRPPAVATDMRLELAWTIIPLGIVMVIFGWGAKIWIENGRLPQNAMEISVIGKQWMWKVQHPEGRREINELHVPIGKKIILNMTSQDVIHDFYCPEMRVKHDVIPGRYSQEWFEPTTVGKYHLFCSQYCGSDHAEMVGWVYVMSQTDYQAWLVNSSIDEPPAVAGARVFAAYSCNTCHGVQAPTLANLYGSKVRLEDGSTVIADDDYIRESIVAPRAKIVAGYPPIMPTYKGQLSEEQIIDLIAYIKTLGSGIPGGGEQAGGVTNLKPAGKVGDYITDTPMPNVRNLVPLDGPAANNAPGQPTQVPGVKSNPRPTTQQ